jgi:cysteine desulfurase/selenocysteine lyase
LIFDFDRARKETPGVKKVTHFNNAGAALPPAKVLNAQIDHLRLEASIGGYEAADRERRRIEAVYLSVANLIGARPQEIAIVENATVAWDMAFYAIPFKPGDRILTAEAEYGANFVAFLQVAKRTGAVIEVIPSTETGETSTEALEAMMDERVKLVAISHVPTNGGLVNPAAEIGRIAKAHGALYLLDACQSVGQMPINVAELQCDMLSATGRKYLRGPRGVGFLYVREALIETLEPPIIDHYAANWTAPDAYTLRPDARRFENWENNYAAKLGLGVAVDYSLHWGLDAIQERVTSLAEYMREKVAAVDGVEVMDLGINRSGIVTFIKADEDPTEVKRRLGAQAINLSVSNPESTLLDATRRKLPPLVRASVHYYNTKAEIERMARVLAV